VLVQLRPQVCCLRTGVSDRQRNHKAEGALDRVVFGQVPELQGDPQEVVVGAVVAAGADPIPTQNLGRTGDVIQGRGPRIRGHSAVDGRWTGVVEVRSGRRHHHNSVSAGSRSTPRLHHAVTGGIDRGNSEEYAEPIESSVEDQ